MSKKISKKDNASITIENKNLDDLYGRVAPVIREARATVMRTIDVVMVKAYWNIGKYLVEEEQRGATRADYGKEILLQLSKRLSKEFGRGFGITTLEDIRKFYLVYQPITKEEKPHAVRGEFGSPPFDLNLSWTHYRLLMRITRPEARIFYELEASKNRCSSRELDRQIGSLLFDRLAKSKDKEGLMRLTQKGQEFTNPADAIKEPIVLPLILLSLQLPQKRFQILLLNVANEVFIQLLYSHLVSAK